MIASLADVFRLASVGGGLVLALVSGAGAALVAGTWDQRGRFLVLGVLGGIVSSTALGALGRDLRWEVPVITALVWGGVVCTVPALVRAVHRLRRPEGG